jgi:hypothetical protein
MTPTPVTSASPTPPAAGVNEAAAWTAVIARDRRHDGEFVYAVSTTGVYCRPGCPSRKDGYDLGTWSFLKTGWWILHVIAIVGFFYLGYLYGASVFR